MLIPHHDDLVGFQPAFRRVARAPGDSPSHARQLVALLDAGPVGDTVIDPLGLATMLYLGFPLGERTPFAGIERFPTGLVIGASGRPREVRRLAPPARAPGTDEIVEMFLDACRRHAPTDDPVVMLSGGRDSRLLLLGLRALGRTPRAVLTVGRPGFVPDATTAAAVGASFGLRVQSCDGMVYSGDREISRHRAQSFESLEHEWLSVLVRQAHRIAGPDPAITDGLGAGVLSTGSLMHEEAIALWRRGAVDELAEWVLGVAVGVGPRFVEAVRREGYPLASRDEVLQSVSTTLRGLGCWPNPLGAFSLFHWSRRGISASPFGLLSHSDRVFAPLCDDALVEALLALDIDEAFAMDWREPVIERMWGPGSMPSYAEGAPRRTIRSRLRLGASALSWWMFTRRLPARLRRLAGCIDADQSRIRQTFNRSAVAYLAALQAILDGGAPGQADASGVSRERSTESAHG